MISFLLGDIEATENDDSMLSHAVFEVEISLLTRQVLT